jgi:CPA2 family monovalent cation:H+ antiporter-2
MPPLVGYLIAGVLVGPLYAGLRRRCRAGCSSSSEVGVILLMFGVGLHFSASDLLSSARPRHTRRASVRSACATLLGMGLCSAARLDRASARASIVGLSAVRGQSTVVLLKALQERHIWSNSRERQVSPSAG